MKGALVSVLTGFVGLGSDEAHERPVDRLGAAGMAGRTKPDQERDGTQRELTSNALRTAHLASFGVDLVAFKFSNSATRGKDCEDKLALILAWPQWRLKLTAKQRDLVAHQAIREWAIDLCPACKGAREVPFHGEVDGTQRMKFCSPCDGTGKRRYSDHERTEAMGKPYDKEMSRAHDLIGTAEKIALQRALALYGKDV